MQNKKHPHGAVMLSVECNFSTLWVDVFNDTMPLSGSPQGQCVVA